MAMLKLKECPFCGSEVTQEIADSLVIIEQIRIANGIKDKEVNAVVAEKLSRQLGRIQKEAET